MQVIFAFLVLIAGMAAPTQAGINSKLSQYLQSNFLAALVSFGVGTTALLAYTIILRLQFPPTLSLAKIPWWLWLGGLCGAYLVTVTLTAAPILGATTMFSFLLAGQMLGSLALDHFGLLDYPVHPINGWRILGVAFLFIGVLLIKKF